MSATNVVSRIWWNFGYIVYCVCVCVWLTSWLLYVLCSALLSLSLSLSLCIFYFIFENDTKTFSQSYFKLYTSGYTLVDCKYENGFLCHSFSPTQCEKSKENYGERRRKKPSHCPYIIHKVLVRHFRLLFLLLRFYRNSYLIQVDICVCIHTTMMLFLSCTNL